MSGHATAAAPLHAKRVRQPAELGRELQALHAVPLQLRIRVQRALIFGLRKPRCLAALQAGKFGDQVLPDVTQRCSQDEDQRESGNYHRPPCRPEREANSNLIRPLRHGVRNNAIDANRRKRQSDGRKDG